MSSNISSSIQRSSISSPDDFIVLNAEVPFNPRNPITYRSVNLRFSPFSQQFGASIWWDTNNVNADENQEAQVISPSRIGNLKEQMARMSVGQKREHFFRTFNVEVQRTQNDFKVILTYRSSPNHVQFQGDPDDFKVNRSYNSTLDIPRISLSSNVLAQNFYSTTTELAEELRKRQPKGDYYEFLQEMALRAIETFAQKKCKTKAIIEEATALGSANNTLITRELIKKLIGKIDQENFNDINFLQGLRSTLVNSPKGSLDRDDLMQILRVIREVLVRIHTPEENKLHEVLLTISDILDVMVDAQVMKVKREEHKDLYNRLDEFSDHKNSSISATASYAKQALVRISDDESRLRAALRHGNALIDGFSSLYKAVTDQDISSLIDAYKSFKDAADYNESQKSWYESVRILKLLEDKNQFKKIYELLQIQFKKIPSKKQVGNVLVMLCEVINHNESIETKQSALKLISEIFLQDKRWGGYEKIKLSIIENLVYLAQDPSKTVSHNVQQHLLLLLSTKNKENKKFFGKLTSEDVKALKNRESHHLEVPSTELIEAAQRPDAIPLKHKIYLLKNKVLNDVELLKQLSSSIPLLGSHILFDSTNQTLELDHAMESFLKGDQTVFLLLGESGSGKTTYLRHLEQHLWSYRAPIQRNSLQDHVEKAHLSLGESYGGKPKNQPKLEQFLSNHGTPSQPIPLFISLASLENPFGRAIEETLSRLGFTAENQNLLKNTHSFVFLFDGYDELKEMNNLILKNNLDQWNAKIIVTCRTQHLSGLQTNYRNYFLPSQNLEMDEFTISPLTLSQSKDLYQKLTHLDPTNSKSWEQFQSDMDAIPGIQEMIQTPLFLRILINALPELVKRQKTLGQEKSPISRLELYDIFIDNWFNEEQKRLIRAGDKSDIRLLSEQAEKLALEMVSADCVFIDGDLWKRYFTFDPIHSGLPLRRLGTSYEFVHQSVLDYFAARAIFPKEFLVKKPQGLNSHESKQEPSHASSSSSAVSEDKITPFLFRNLNKGLFSKHSDLIRFLAEYLTLYPNLVNSLFRCIESCKNNLSQRFVASNAITILNAAGINLSLRDFSHINFRGANLSNAILTHANFSYADLRDVQLYGAVIDYSTFAFAKTKGIEFGQKPFIQNKIGQNFSPNGKWLHYKETDEKKYFTGKVLFYDLESKQARYSFPVNDGLYQTAYYSLDSKKALICNPDHSLTLLDLESGKKQINLVGHKENVLSIAFSRDGTKALSASVDHTVRLWNLERGEEIQCLRGHTDMVNCVAYSPNGKWGLSGSQDRTAILWDLDSGTKLRSYRCGQVWCVAISPNNGWVAIGGRGSLYEGSLHIWKIVEGDDKKRPSLKSCKGLCRSVAFSPDSKSIAFASDDSYIVRVLDVESGKERLSFEGHRDLIHSVEFSKDGNWIFSTCFDHTKRIWNINRKEVPIQTRSKFKDFNYFIAYSPCENYVVSLDKHLYFDTLRAWDLRGGKEIFCRDVPAFSSVAISDDQIWHYSEKTRLRESEVEVDLFERELEVDLQLWGLKGEERFLLKGHTRIVDCLVFNGRYAISGSGDKTVRVWDLHSRSEGPLFAKHVFTGHDDYEISRVALSPDNRWAISSGVSSTRLWNLELNKESFSWEFHTHNFAFSPDSKSAIFTRGQTLFHRDFESGVERHFIGHTETINCVVYSRNGDWVMSGSSDKTIRVWNLKSDLQHFCLNGHTNAVRHVKFSPDGLWALSSSGSDTVRLWNLEKKKEELRFHTRIDCKEIHFLADGRHISFASDSDIEVWQIVDAEHRLKPALVSSTVVSKLSAQNLILERVQIDELSEDNYQLLLQHGAIDQEQK